ncbi:hypothetical protein ACIPUB_12675 [Paeniglutamicibacter sp. ORCA_105]|uniref:hypothetical protein n=1 Tax=Paeniglutamicibacter sp. ORCA_105 TaxID=3377336 RepID=UPI003894426D
MSVRLQMPPPSPEVVYPGNILYWPELPGVIVVCAAAIILLSFLMFPIRRWRRRK